MAKKEMLGDWCSDEPVVSEPILNSNVNVSICISKMDHLLYTNLTLELHLNTLAPSFKNNPYYNKGLMWIIFSSLKIFNQISFIKEALSIHPKSSFRLPSSNRLEQNFNHVNLIELAKIGRYCKTVLFNMCQTWHLFAYFWPFPNNLKCRVKFDQKRKKHRVMVCLGFKPGVAGR